MVEQSHIHPIFAIIKILSINELFEDWCSKNNISKIDSPSLTDILNTLPEYTTTGVSEPRAVLHIKTMNHAALKTAFQKIFQEQWKAQKVFLENYGITSFEAVITNGTKETRNVTDYSQSGKGGLKILFKNSRMENLAFIWMRGSGTEPVFRILCDVKGDTPEMEKALLSWETEMIQKADEMCCSE